MMYMQPTLGVRNRKREKGFWGSLGMALIGGQSFFVNDFTAESSAVRRIQLCAAWGYRHP